MAVHARGSAAFGAIAKRLGGARGARLAIELRPGGPAALLAPCALRLAWGRHAQRAEGLRFVARDHAPELLFEAEQLAACVYARFLLCEDAHHTLEDAGFQPLAVTDEGYPSAMVKLLRTGHALPFVLRTE